MSRIPTPLIVNCGYSRVAIWECSHLPCTSVNYCNIEETAEKIQQLFTDGLLISMPSSHWAIGNSKKCSKFDRHCEHVLKCFKYKRWHCKLTRSEYLKKFWTDNWTKLSSEEREFHSLSNCNWRCAIEHLEFQKSFPSLPIFEPETAERQSNIIEVNLPSTSGTTSTRDESEVTREVLATLDNSYQSEFNHSFNESVVKHCGKSEGIVHKETRVQKNQKLEICKENLLVQLMIYLQRKLQSVFYLKTSR